MTTRPHIFIGSSKESEWIAKAARESLSGCGEVDVWTTEVFRPGHSFLSDLLKQVAISDFAVIVATADDIAEIRGEQQWVPRDNVIFELGLFTSVLGPERAFILCAIGSKAVKLPTDILGHTFVPFTDDLARRQQEIDAACFKIQKSVEKLGPFRQGTPATIITRAELPLPEHQLRWTDIESRCEEELLIVGWSCRNVISARTRNVFKNLVERKCPVRFLMLHPDVLDNPFDMGPVCHISGEHIKSDIKAGRDSVEELKGIIDPAYHEFLELRGTKWFMAWSAVAIDKEKSSGILQVELYHYGNPYFAPEHLDKRVNLIFKANSWMYQGFADSVKNMWKAAEPLEI